MENEPQYQPVTLGELLMGISGTIIYTGLGALAVAQNSSILDGIGALFFATAGYAAYRTCKLFKRPAYVYPIDSENIEDL